eukprot:5631893-Pyramimonas_sp.AAC.1
MAAGPSQSRPAQRGVVTRRPPADPPSSGGTNAPPPAVSPPHLSLRGAARGGGGLVHSWSLRWGAEGGGGGGAPAMELLRRGGYLEATPHGAVRGGGLGGACSVDFRVEGGGRVVVGDPHDHRRAVLLVQVLLGLHAAVKPLLGHSTTGEFNSRARMFQFSPQIFMEAEKVPELR